ncbi:hypothetical protein H4R21_003619 [Coemansia helicoidea]|uniref:Uncharacterized protein n=1 Tax=Coemansia helicoidea TaxID=1286919 RepID=A0ACC1L0W6_9FUNG|nr:hypothetical protein H4R21_003619 [Coemansia helicoidea]
MSGGDGTPNWPAMLVDGESLPARLLSRSQSSRRRTSVRRGHAPGLRPHSIARVDTPPVLDMSIHAIDTLFKQYRQDLCSEDGGDGGSPTSLTPSTRSSLDSDDTLAEPRVAGRTVEKPSTPPAAAVSCSTGTVDDAHVSPPPPPPPPPQLLGQLMEVLFPWPQPGAEPYHIYYIVATLDMQPAIPQQYPCPTAMCAGRFACFEDLQQHWPTHPWNRRGALVPVAAGGIRRLTFWQHKAIYVRSLLRVRTTDGMVTSDFGDIRLFGPKSYFVSPRVVPIERVRAWEAAAAPRTRL